MCVCVIFVGGLPMVKKEKQCYLKQLKYQRQEKQMNKSWRILALVDERLEEP